MSDTGTPLHNYSTEPSLNTNYTEAHLPNNSREASLTSYYTGVPLHNYSSEAPQHPYCPGVPLHTYSTETPQHPYSTRQASKRRVLVKSVIVPVESDSQTMGGLLSKGHGMFCRVIKQIKTDGNGNLSRTAPAPQHPPHSSPLPLRVEMALEQPQEENKVQLEHAWNPADRSLNIFVKNNDPYTFHRYSVILL